MTERPRRVRVRAKDAFFAHGVQLYVLGRRSDRDAGSVYLTEAEPFSGEWPPVLIAREVDAVEDVPPPLLTLGREDAQQLVDDLYAAGVRPSESAGAPGALSATERHLRDLQAIVSKSLGVELLR